MKTAPKVIFLLKDADGFGASISDALQPNPNSDLRKLEDSFDLSLDRYGIKDYKASGDITHFVDDNGIPQVSILLLQKYEPPVLACAINEVIASLVGQNEMSTLMLILPFFLAAPNLNLESKSSAKKNIIYGIRKGPETVMTRTLATRTQKLPLSFQIHHESLSCILQFVHALNLPAFTLIGQSDQDMSHKTSTEELELAELIGSSVTKQQVNSCTYLQLSGMKLSPDCQSSGRASWPSWLAKVMPDSKLTQRQTLKFGGIIPALDC